MEAQVHTCLQRISTTLKDTSLHLSGKELRTLYNFDWKGVELGQGDAPCIVVEDYSIWILRDEELCGLITKLSKLLSGLSSSWIRFSQLLAHDLLLFSCIIPSVVIKYDSTLLLCFIPIGRFAVPCAFITNK